MSKRAYETRRSSGHRLQLVFTRESRDLLEKLKEAIEADSYGEVVRRALLAYEEFAPKEPPRSSENVVVVDFRSPAQREPRSCTKRLQIVLPVKSFERLSRFKDDLIASNGEGSYAEVIRQALRVFTQLVRNGSDPIQNKKVANDKQQRRPWPVAGIL